MSNAPLPRVADLSFESLFLRYILAGCSAVILWDILSNLRSEFILLVRHRFRVATGVYIISRLSTIAFVVMATMYGTAPIQACSQYVLAVHILMAGSIGTTSLLFLIRVRAIYEASPRVTAFFALSWLAVLGCFIFTLQGLEAYPESNPSGTLVYCATGRISPYIALDFVMPLVHDTLVFLAISWRLATNTLYNNANRDSIIKQGVRAMVFGHYMPAFSRALLQDGQIYYLTTITTGLLAFVMLFITSAEVTWKTTFLVPNMMLMNIMACHVFRKTKLGIFTESGVSTINPPTLPIAFHVPTGASSPYIPR
ncbi:hypothetical protein JR316_0011672 [Psilocybe cubensis]|uniref:Uncharacterized protein n=1 Tax=Psilocybe cubensis TaxID=181762 RepID=A0ACB8GL41_PSICU|nr:hypothetical protein JR316_0011672 [Psilocybe cubensis]KAH9476102.1 hypothetical protein JR316_0011672 [Psilocybe cubensis]